METQSINSVKCEYLNQYQQILGVKGLSLYFITVIAILLSTANRAGGPHCCQREETEASVIVSVDDARVGRGCFGRLLRPFLSLCERCMSDIWLFVVCLEGFSPTVREGYRLGGSRGLLNLLCVTDNFSKIWSTCGLLVYEFP